MKYHFIYNPSARSGRNKKTFREVIRQLKKGGQEFEVTATKRKDHATEIAQNITKDDAPIIVAAGGDGTLCEVLTGIMHHPSEKRPVLAGLHIGTSGDFAKHHNIPTQAEDFVNFLTTKSAPKKIDLGKIEYRALKKNKTKTAYFSCNANIGLGPKIASKPGNRLRAYLGNYMGTALSTLISLKQHQPSDVSIKKDGKRAKLKNLHNLTIGKNPYLASGMRIPYEFPCDNGKFYCFSMQCPSKLKLLFQLWRLYWGNILDFKGASLQQGKKITIKSDDSTWIEFDGDVRGRLPATIEIIPRAIKLLKPLNKSTHYEK